jgi:hypothetical protein
MLVPAVMLAVASCTAGSPDRSAPRSPVPAATRLPALRRMQAPWWLLRPLGDRIPTANRSRGTRRRGEPGVDRIAVLARHPDCRQNRALAMARELDGVYRRGS